MNSYKFNIRKKLLIATTTTIIVSMLFNFNPIFKAFELQVLDFLISLKGEKQPHKNIVLIIEDDETVAQYGWPMPRIIYASLIDSLTSFGAKVISYDILFNDKSNSIDDDSLASASQRSGNIVHAVTFDIYEDEQDYDPGAEQCDDTFYSKYSLQLTSSARSDYYRASNPCFPHKIFFEFFDKAGHTTIIQDEDGHFRRIPLIIYYEGCYYPALAFKTTCEYLNIPDEGIYVESDFWGDKLIIQSHQDTIEIPIDKKGQVLLNFYGDLNIFPQYSLLDVLQGQVTAEYFKDKIVLIGKTVTGDTDAIVNPFSSEFPGIGVHATLASNILGRDFIKELPYVINFLLVFFLSLVITFYPSKKYHGLFFSSLYSLLWLIVISTIGYCLFKYPASSIWLKMAPNTAVIFFSFIGVSCYEKWEFYERLKNIKEQLKMNEQILREKDNEIKNLEWRFDMLQMYFSNIESIRNDIKNIEGKVPTEVKEDLHHILKNQDEFQTVIVKLLNENEKLIEKINDDQKRYGDIERQLLKEKGKYELISIGTYHTIEIYENERTIVIIGTKTKTEKIYFPRVDMAFIYYLARARLKKQEWIKDGEITEIDEAAKASRKFGHHGIIGCESTGKKHLSHLRSEELTPDNFAPDPQLVRRYSSEINTKIKNYIREDEKQKFIRTPGKKHDGRYFLAESITKVVFH